MSDLRILVTTFPDRTEAERITGLLVDGGLVVCGQIGADITSFYRWQGQVKQDSEVGVTYKVLANRLELCVGELKLQHPYEVPQIISWPAGYVDKAYLDWARGKS